MRLRGWRVRPKRRRIIARPEEFAPLGNRFAAFRCDLREQDDVTRMIAEVEQRLGPLDVLVNNAGMIQVGPVESLTIADFENAMRTNFWSAVYTTFAVLPSMRRRRGTRIVNVASIGGKIAVPHLLPYSASKFALLGFSEGLRTELAKYGISVTTVVPGLMRTGSPRNVEVKGQHQKEYAWFILADSAPGISMNAVVAARKIVRACASRKGEVVIGVPAKVAAMVAALAPNVVNALMSAGNTFMLPSNGRDGGVRAGWESESRISRSLLTSLTRQAELANNQS